MSFPQAKYRTNKLFAACAVLLCLAVLLWGTSYKMSLYSTVAQFGYSQANPVNPPAKLLSEKERPIRTSSLDHNKTTPELTVAPLLIWVFFVLTSAMQVRIRLQWCSARAWLAHHLHGNEDSLLSHFGFRPPPSIYLLLS